MILDVVEPSVKFIASTPNIGEVIEFACRTCYKSHDRIKEGSAEKLFNQVVKQHHHDSVTEHGSITVHITTDRATMAQFTRHRIGFAYSVESQRYVNYTKDKFDNAVTFIKPMAICDHSDAYFMWENSMRASAKSYFDLISEGMKPETARSVLPNSTKTEVTVTGNVRAWRHFFSLRADGHAQKDIQHLSKLIYRSFIENDVPKWLFDDIIKTNKGGDNKY